MRASLLNTSLRVLTWGCVILLAILSLLPDQQMMRTGLPGRVEHFVAYAGSAAIAVAGYGASRGGVQIIGGFWVYAAILEYLQHSPAAMSTVLIKIALANAIFSDKSPALSRPHCSKVAVRLRPDQTRR